MHELELTLESIPTAPGAARQAVRTWLDARRCGDDAADTASLLVTELVTNAFLHATGPGFCLTIDETRTDVLRIAVRDHSRVTPRRPPQAPDENQTSGRGLFLVEALSTGWGWEPLRVGKRVWFELPCGAVPNS